MTMAVNDGYFLKTHRCAFNRPIRGDLFVAGHPGKILFVMVLCFVCWNENDTLLNESD